jgi:protein involved in polysaccharide export with SLBB domain
MGQINFLKRMAPCLMGVAVLFLLAGCETGGGLNGRENKRNPSTKIPFQVGELVSVKFSGVDTAIPEHEERIKEDGTITLAQIGAVKAEGKTPGELQRDIRAHYVPKYYSESFTVTVRSQDRFFYVGGEVKLNNRYPWIEGMTVVKAIQNAGGLTEWAKASKVRVTGQDGKTFLVNYSNALVKPELDIPVEPNDTINIPRRGW